jgi:isopenicillin-N epimerase
MNFGKSIRHHWLLEGDCIFLNHGSFGATPKVVLAAQSKWRSRMEAQPIRFIDRELGGHLRAAASELAAFVGAKGEDLVFVENATAGINAVVRSLDFLPGDQIVTTNHAYAAVRKTLSYVCQRSGASLVEANIPFPLDREDEVVEAVANVLNPNVKLLVVDHVTSPTALVMPVAKLVALARSHHIPILIDGAHAPGMLPLQLEELGADWYAGNCHKWLFAAKGCGFLWVKPERQNDIHPVVISNGFGTGFHAEFDWVGTRDYGAWLAITDAIAFHQHLSSELGTELYAHNHDLALWAAQMLAQTLAQPLPAPLNMLGAMATIEIPAQNADWDCRQIHDHLWSKHQIEVPIIPFDHKLWVRVSAQAYNEAKEYEALANALQSGF